MKNLNEVAALELILKFVPLKDLVKAAMNGFAEETDVRSKENADICFKALETFLN